MGVTVSSSHVVSAAPSSSGGGLLTFLPCFSVGSLPLETVLHELLQCGALQKKKKKQIMKTPTVCNIFLIYIFQDSLLIPGKKSKCM